MENKAEANPFGRTRREFPHITPKAQHGLQELSVEWGLVA